jgi:hypothetical protein
MKRMGESERKEGSDTHLVRANPGSLERLAAQLLILIGDEMAAEGELVDRGAFATEVEDPDLNRLSQFFFRK